ncbi:MAG: hypothetical protein ACOCOO_00560 [Prevotella sp.]
MEFQCLAASATWSCGIRRMVVWHPPHDCVAFATRQRGIRRTTAWQKPHCSLTLLVDYFKPYF